MKVHVVPLRGMAMAAALCAAQSVAAPAAMADDAQVAPPAPIDPESIPVPNLAFTPDAEIERNYSKYFFFHREETDFHTAYADIQECDGYARGLAYRAGQPNAYVFYAGIGGVVGGVVGNMLADAIYGSAERRRQRRVTMRTCMGFKGYRAYGLPRDLWREFNFDEGNRQTEDERRERLLMMQARAASGPRPQVGEMPQ